MKLLNKPIDIAILVYFRFFAGLLLAQELINALFIGKFHEYTSPKFHFSYLFFPFIKPWPPSGMALHFAVTILAGLFLAFGKFYRLSAILLFLGYSSMFLMEMGEYINHIYLYSLISFWMIFLPLGREELKDKAPAWMLYLILFHMALAYFFGGIAKINPDWLRGTPMDIYLAARENHPLSFIYAHKWSPLIFSWGGMLFDLLIVPALIWKRSRIPAFIIAVCFHLSNVAMFGLATFPWMSIVLSTMFFDPSWPRRLPYFHMLLPDQRTSPTEFNFKWLPATCISIYVLIHLMLPFRHFMYPGDPSWTEEAHMFSWRMMLRDKVGSVQFIVMDKKTKHVSRVRLNEYLTERQIRIMTGKPDMILQFAHFLRDEHQKKGKEVKVFATSKIGLNGRKPQEMIKSKTDLAMVERSLGHYDWIIPLKDYNTKSRQGFGPVALDER